MENLGLIPGLGRSPGERKGYPCQYSGLENSMDCIVQGVAKSQTGLSDFHFHFFSSVNENLLLTEGAGSRHLLTSGVKLMVFFWLV